MKLKNEHGPQLDKRSGRWAAVVEIAGCFWLFGWYGSSQEAGRVCTETKREFDCLDYGAAVIRLVVKFKGSGMPVKLGKAPLAISELPRGVSYKPDRKKYQTSVRINGRQKHLGYFDTAEQALQVRQAYIQQ